MLLATVQEWEVVGIIRAAPRVLVARVRIPVSRAIVRRHHRRRQVVVLHRPRSTIIRLQMRIMDLRLLRSRRDCVVLRPLSQQRARRLKVSEVARDGDKMVVESSFFGRQWNCVG